MPEDEIKTVVLEEIELPPIKLRAAVVEAEKVGGVEEAPERIFELEELVMSRELGFVEVVE